jgi:hypothetical protein
MVESFAEEHKRRAFAIETGQQAFSSLLWVGMGSCTAHL